MSLACSNWFFAPNAAAREARVASGWGTLAKRIVDAHGGKIELSSGVGAGIRTRVSRAERRWMHPP